MQRYVTGRVLQALVTLLLLSMLVFVLARLSGDVLNVMLPDQASQEDRENMARYLGLDKPLPQQYAIYMGHVLTGDFGTSLKARVPVTRLFLDRVPNTIRLAAFTLVVAVSLALVLGIGAAVYRGSIIDTICRVLAVSGISIPSFWLAIMAVLVFAVRLGILPATGTGGIQHYILPGTIMGWILAAPMTRLLRSSMLEVMESEYVKLARIKGVAEGRVIWWHTLRNALIPLVTVIGSYMGTLVGGLVILETVFVWPGVGLLAYQSLLWRDYPVIQGVVLLVSAAILAANLGVDILYAYIDPRIRY